MSSIHQQALLFPGQGIVSYQQHFNLQINTPTTIPSAIKDENSILIQNLDRFVTESMLHLKFSEIGDIKQITLKTNKISGTSLGSALIEFRNESSVKEAVRKFNMRKFFENNQGEQKLMEVIPKISKQKLDQLKQTSRLFFKIILENEADTINPTEVSDFLSIYGDIHQIRFNSKKGKLLSYGKIIFKSSEGKERALKGVSGTGMTGKGFTFQFYEYDVNQQKFNLHVTEHNLINQPISDSVLSNPQELEKERARLEEKIKEDIKKNEIEYESIYFSIDSKHKKPFFFISFKNAEMAEKTQKLFSSHGAIITSLSNRKSADEQFKILHLKNLKVLELTEEQRTKAIENFRQNFPEIQIEEKIIIQDQVNLLMKQKIEQDLANLKFENFSVKIYLPPDNSRNQTNNPGKEFQESRQATLQFGSAKQGIQLLQTYLEKPYSETIKTWFIGGVSAGKINILLSSNDLQLYKKSKQKGQQEQQQKHQRQVLASMFQQSIQQTPQYQTTLPNQYPQIQQTSSQPPVQQQNSGQTTFQQRNPINPTNQSRYNNNYNNNNNYNQGQRNPQNAGRGYNYQNQIQQNRGQQNFQQGFNNQNRNVSYPGNQRVQGNYNQGQASHQYTQSNRGQGFPPTSMQSAKPVQAIPVQINANQIQQQQAPSQQLSMTVDQIRENPDDFLKKPDETKKTILGQLIYPKVKAKLDSRNEDSKHLTPKITGMLIDFTVFELEDIIDMIDREEDLVERIEEALELIKNPPQ